MIFFMLIKLLKVFTGFSSLHSLLLSYSAGNNKTFFNFSISVKNYGSRFSCFAYLKHFFLNTNVYQNVFNNVKTIVYSAI